MAIRTNDDEEMGRVRDALGDEFDVLRPLGKGSTATVILARERALDRLVAIKVLRRGAAKDETARRRFDREARAAASISEHPDVVGVHRCGRLPDGTPYLVMRYVKGRTLAERLAAEGRLPLDDALEVLRRVASALAAAHERGIVHRDVRPGNVLWDDDAGRAYLSDFGIAAILATSALDSSRLTQMGQTVGDPRYLSPEQFEDRPLTEQSDVYGFGLLGYEVLTGEGPYGARTNVEWIRAHLQADPRDVRELRSDVPPHVADLLRRCLAREPNHRPRAADVVRLLDAPSRAGVAAAVDPDSGRAAPGELMKRRVPQIVGSGLAIAWGIIEGTSQASSQWDWPSFFNDLSWTLGGAVVLGSLILGWFHGARGRQKAPLVEYVLLGIVALVWLGLSGFLIVRGVGAGS